MQFGILLLLAAFPILELVLLIEFGRAFGFWATLLLILGTGFGGVWLIQRQGFALITRLRETLAGQHSASEPDLSGSLLMLAGLLLLLPGPMTDFAGVLLLFPPIRRMLDRRMRRHVHVFTSRPERPTPDDTPRTNGPIIDGEFERIDERKVDGGPKPQSGPKP